MSSKREGTIIELNGKKYFIVLNKKLKGGVCYYPLLDGDFNNYKKWLLQKSNGIINDYSVVNYLALGEACEVVELGGKEEQIIGEEQGELEKKVKNLNKNEMFKIIESLVDVQLKESNEYYENLDINKFYEGFYSALSGAYSRDIIGRV